MIPAAVHSQVGIGGATAAGRSFTVSNNAGVTITGGGGSRRQTADGLAFTISPKPGVGVIFEDTKSGIRAVAQGNLDGVIQPATKKGEKAQLRSAQTGSPIVVNKTVVTGSSSAAGNKAVVTRASGGYDVNLTGLVVLTSTDSKLGQNVVANGDRGTVVFDQENKASGFESLVSATLVGSVKVQLKLIAIPDVQEAGNYTATGDKLILGPRGATRTLTLTGDIKISGDASEQNGTVTGATRLILTLNAKGEIIGEEIVGDEPAGKPMKTVIPAKKPPVKSTTGGGGA